MTGHPSAPRSNVGGGCGPGGAGRLTARGDLDLGPHHPSSHGGLRLRLHVEGDRIVACEPEVGYLHRGVEKLFEVRDYRQILVLANRHDWLSAFSSELGSCWRSSGCSAWRCPPARPGPAPCWPSSTGC